MVCDKNGRQYVSLTGSNVSKNGGTNENTITRTAGQTFWSKVRIVQTVNGIEITSQANNQDGEYNIFFDVFDFTFSSTAVDADPVPYGFSTDCRGSG